MRNSRRKTGTVLEFKGEKKQKNTAKKGLKKKEGNVATKNQGENRIGMLKTSG